MKKRIYLVVLLAFVLFDQMFFGTVQAQPSNEIDQQVLDSLALAEPQFYGFEQHLIHQSMPLYTEDGKNIAGYLYDANWDGVTRTVIVDPSRKNVIQFSLSESFYFSMLDQYLSAIQKDRSDIDYLIYQGPGSYLVQLNDSQGPIDFVNEYAQMNQNITPLSAAPWSRT